MKTVETGHSRRITLKDIAKRLDVSHATVSRALNRPEDPLISEATRLRVQQVASEMGYRPNLAARSLATGRTGLFALWLWSEGIPNSYHANVSQLMNSAAQSHSYQLLVNLTNRNTLAQSKSQLFDAWHVDGIIAHEAGPASQAQFHSVARPSVPVVTSGAYHLLEGFDRVEVDVEAGAVLAMEHLLAIGRRRITYVTDDLAHRKDDPRFKAYSDLLDGNGLKAEFIDVPNYRAGVRSQIREHVRQYGVPEALLCHNDDIAIAAYRGLCDLGVRVPDDTAIVGCDGIEDTEYLEVPITTIAQPLGKLCELACQFLEQRIEDPSRPLQRARLNAELVIRASTGGSSLPPYSPL